MDFFIYLLAIIILLIFTISIIISSLSIAPWLPSSQKDFQRINHLANLKPGQIFYELGCGDGRVGRYIAKNNPQCQTIGIEICIPIFLWAKLKQVLGGPKNMSIRLADALKQDISEADVIYTFAFTTSISGKVKDKLIEDMKPSGKALSYVFPIDHWSGETTVDKPDQNSVSIFCYRK